MTDFDVVRAELTDILGDKKKLRKARILEYVCRKCGQPLLSVIATSHGRVVYGRIVRDLGRQVPNREITTWVGWSELDSELVPRPDVATVEDMDAIVGRLKDRDQGTRVKASIGLFVPIADDYETAAHGTDESFYWDCRCTVAEEIPAGMVAADLAHRTRKRTWPV